MRDPIALRFTVEGPPVPKARARTVRVRGKVRSFTPEKTAAYEKHVAFTALRYRPAKWPMDAQYDLNIWVYRVALRGDASNYTKSIEDGLNKILWKDDRQICAQSAVMTIDRKRPRVEVEVIAHRNERRTA